MANTAVFRNERALHSNTHTKNHWPSEEEPLAQYPRNPGTTGDRAVDGAENRDNAGGLL